MSAAFSLLFLGNSYTQNHQLDVVAAAMLAEGTGETALGARLTSGGLTLADHVARAQGSDERWVSALASTESSWDWIFLQEQSQIPGFPEGHHLLKRSVTASGILDGYAQERGAQTVFVMTWGRRDGDSSNPDLYPDFTTMQELLTAGYLRYVDTNTTSERTVWVAPCGLAWQATYNAILADGGDPLADGSLFERLYSSDGSHPSPAGNHLNAAVIYATLTGESPVGLSDPSGQVDKKTAAQLQAIAAEVVLSGTPDIRYPWQDTQTDDTDPQTDDTDPQTDDTDPQTDDTEPDTEDTTSQEQDTEEQLEPEHGEPGGCRSSKAMLLPLMLLPLLRVRRW